MTHITTSDSRHLSSALPPRRGVHSRQVAAAVIVLGLIGGEIGWTLGGTRTAGHTSVASMVINPLPGNPFYDESLARLEVLETEAQRPRSDAVLSDVVEQLGGTVDAAVLLQRVSVGVAPRSEVIEVTYRGGSARASAEIAEALAQATLDDRQNRAANVAERQISELRETVRATRTAISDSNDPAEQQLLSRREVLLTNQIRELEDQSFRAGAVIGVTTEPNSTLKVQAVVSVSLFVVGAVAGLSLGRLLTRRSRRSI